MKKNIAFLDTCILSEAIQDNKIRENLRYFIAENNCSFGIAMHTLSELQKSKSLYAHFLNYLTEAPFFLIKPTKLIVTDEFSKLKFGTSVNISFLFFSNYAHELDKLTSSLVSIVDREFPKGSKFDVVNNISHLIKNYPPQNGRTYSDNEVIYFCKRVLEQQLLTHYSDIVEPNKIGDLSLGTFKSLESLILIMFWKFYKSSDRLIKDSDAFDIAMSSCFPYVDYIISERDMVENINQIKRKSLAFVNLKRALTIRDIIAAA